jgi:hypothetical protein
VSVADAVAKLRSAAADIANSCHFEEVLPSTCKFKFYQWIEIQATAVGDPYLWEDGHIKTTVELPDSLFRRAKAAAAEEGRSLKDFFTDAVR